MHICQWPSEPAKTSRCPCPHSTSRRIMSLDLSVVRRGLRILHQPPRGTAACGDDGTLVVVIYSCRDSSFGKLDTEQLMSSIYLIHSTARHLGRVLQRPRPHELLDLQYSVVPRSSSLACRACARSHSQKSTCIRIMPDQPPSHVCMAGTACMQTLANVGNSVDHGQQHHCSGYTTSADTCDRPSAAAIFNYSSHLLQCSTLLQQYISTVQWTGHCSVGQPALASPQTNYRTT